MARHGGLNISEQVTDLYGWDGMGDGMGWDGMGWDGMGFIRYTWRGRRVPEGLKWIMEGWLHAECHNSHCQSCEL